MFDCWNRCSTSRQRKPINAVPYCRLSREADQTQWLLIPLVVVLKKRVDGKNVIVIVMPISFINCLWQSCGISLDICLLIQKKRKPDRYWPLRFLLELRVAQQISVALINECCPCVSIIKVIYVTERTPVYWTVFYPILSEMMRETCVIQDCSQLFYWRCGYQVKISWVKDIEQIPYIG